MGCREKIESKCRGVRTNSTCSMYYGYIPEKYQNDDDCRSVHDVLDELYHGVELIEKNEDLSELGKSCIDYSEYQVEQKLKVKEALRVIESEICKLKLMPSFFDMSKLDLKCLKNPCGDEISTLEQLLQVLINDKCE